MAASEDWRQNILLPALSVELLAIVQEETGVEATFDTRIEDLGIDSLDFIDLLHVIGKRIKPINNEQAKNIKTVGDILTVLSWE